MTYVESLTTSTGPSRAFAASSTAIISMRWFVVRALAPLAYRPRGTAHSHPPGPGFPEHAPSVYTTIAAGTGTSFLVHSYVSFGQSRRDTVLASWIYHLR